jgi:hypothetical protein
VDETSKIKLSFEHNIGPEDARNIELLSDALQRLDDVQLNNLDRITKSLQRLSGVEISRTLGAGITGLIDTINRLDDVSSISQGTADRLADGFRKIANATRAFEGNTAHIPTGTATIINALQHLGRIGETTPEVARRINLGFQAIANAITHFNAIDMKGVKVPPGLGREITGLVASLEGLDKIPDMSGVGDRLKDGFQKIAEAVKVFPRDEFENIKIPTNLGKSVIELITAINQISEIKDISGQGAKLDAGFSAIAKAVAHFDGISARIPVTLGKGVTGIVDAINKISTVQDITPAADRLNRGFATLATAVRSFEGISARIPATLGKGVSGLVDAINKINTIQDISGQGTRLSSGFAVIADAVRSFEGVSVRIPATLGKGVSELVTAVNNVTTVQDITPHAARLNSGFQVLATAVQSFEGVSARIPATLGRGIAELVAAINKVTTVQDITPQATKLNDGFRILAQALSHFEGIEGGNYTGIAKLVEALATVNDVKPIDDTVIDNARKLAEAINILDQEVSADTNRLRAMAEIMRRLGLSFRDTERRAESFGRSLKLLNLEAFISLVRQAVQALRQMWDGLKSLVDQYGELQNSMAFFEQSLGGQSQAVAKVLAKYADLGLIDFAEATNNVAILTQMMTGYGISTERAAKMALNFTQLAYDASYAMGENGKDLEFWFKRTRSIVAGYSRSAYYFGVDITAKALAEEFANLNNEVQKGEKLQGAYAHTMNTTTNMQQQFGREIDTAYVRLTIYQNRLKIVGQSLGKWLVPVFMTLTKWALTALKVVTMVITAISKMLNVGLGEFKVLSFEDMAEDMASGIGEGMQGGVAPSEEISDNLADAAGSAKELKKTISGIDQVFTINDEIGGAAAGMGDIASGIGGMGDIELPEYEFMDEEAIKGLEDLFAEIDADAQKVYDTLKEIGPIVAAIAAGFLTWRIAKGLMDALNFLKNLKLAGLAGFDLGLVFGGLGVFLDGWKKFKKAIGEILDEGPTFENVSFLLGSFAEMLAGVFLTIGNLKYAGPLAVIAGIGQIVYYLDDIIENGPSVENVSGLLSAIGVLIIGIGAIKKKTKLLGSGMILVGIMVFLSELDNVMEAIRTGDWSGVDKIALISTALLVLGGLWKVIRGFREATNGGGGGGGGGDDRGGRGNRDPVPPIDDLRDTTSRLTNALKGLVKNLALGIVVVLEVIAIALIITGAIILMGMMLEQVGKAWEPVIENGGTVAAAMLFGAVILGLCGTAAGMLGKVGKPLIINMALGAAILAEIGIATAIILIEIWAIGKALEQIGIAWQPVLDNGETVSTAMKTGAGILAGVGLATAGLGKLGGGLAKSMLIGMAILAEIGLATGLILFEIWAVGKALEQIGIAWQPVLDNGETIAKGMGIGIGLIAAFALLCGGIGAATATPAGVTAAALIGLGMLVIKAISEALVDFITNIVEMAQQLNKLADEVAVFAPKLPALNENMKLFAEGMKTFAVTAGGISMDSTTSALKATLESIVGFFTVDPIKKLSENIKEYSKNFKDINTNLDVAIPRIKKANDSLREYADLLVALKGAAERASEVGDMKSFAENNYKPFSEALKEAFDTLDEIKTENVANIIAALNSIDLSKFKGIGVKMAEAIAAGLNTYKFQLKVAGDNVKTALDAGTKDKGKIVGTDVSNAVMTTVNTHQFAFIDFGKNVETTMNRGLDGKGKEIGTGVAKAVMDAINKFTFNLGDAIGKIKSAFSMDATDIGKNIAKGVEKGINNTTVNISTFETKTKQKLEKAFDENSPSKWARDVVGHFIGIGVEQGINRTKLNLTAFEHNTKNELQKMSKADFTISTEVIPQLDTRRLNGDLKGTTAQLDANVKGNYNYTADGAEKAIEKQSGIMADLMARLIEAVESGSEISIDGDVIARKVAPALRNQAVMRNVAY